MEILPSTLDKCCLMKFLALFSLNSASFLLLVSEQKEWVLVHPYLTSGSQLLWGFRFFF